MFKVALYVFFLIVLAIVAASRASAAIYTYSGTFNATFDLTVDLTLDSDTSTLDLTVTGPADRWFAVGFSVDGSMANSQVLAYSNFGLEDRILDGYGGGYLNTPQTAILNGNVVIGDIRTLTINDWQINFLGWNFNLQDPDTYNPYNMVWAVGNDLNYAYHNTTGSQLVTFEIPEPASAILLLTAACGLAFRRR